MFSSLSLDCTSQKQSQLSVIQKGNREAAVEQQGLLPAPCSTGSRWAPASAGTCWKLWKSQCPLVLLSCLVLCLVRLGELSLPSVSAAGCFTLLGFPCSSSAHPEARLSFSPELCGRQSIGPSRVKRASWFSSDALRKYCVNGHGLPVESLRTTCLPGLLHSIGYVATGECVGGHRYLSNNGK